MRTCKVCEKVLTRQKIVCSRACRNKLYTTKGKPKSEETKRRMSIASKGMKKPWTAERNKKYRTLGDRHTNWKGDEVGYIAMHNWAHRHVKLKESCESCGSIKRLEMANISQQYKRELTDWKTLCRVCHLAYDLEFRRNGGVSRKLQKWKKQKPQ